MQVASSVWCEGVTVGFLQTRDKTSVSHWRVGNNSGKSYTIKEGDVLKYTEKENDLWKCVLHLVDVFINIPSLLVETNLLSELKIIKDQNHVLFKSLSSSFGIKSEVWC